MERKRRANKGFTLVELVIVMAVISVILLKVTPMLKGMQNESQLTKAEGDLKTLKSAITSYWKNNGNVFPPSIGSLVNANPQIISTPPTDPWNTGSDTGEPGTYAYLYGVDATAGPWFLACTQGPRRTGGGGCGGGGTMPSFNSTLLKIEWGEASTCNGSNFRCVSNVPIVYSDGVMMKTL